MILYLAIYKEGYVCNLTLVSVCYFIAVYEVGSLPFLWRLFAIPVFIVSHELITLCFVFPLVSCVSHGLMCLPSPRVFPPQAACVSLSLVVSYGLVYFP